MSVCLSVCLSVRYAFSPCNGYRHQTFHDISLGPEEGRHGVGITKKGQKGGYLGEISPSLGVLLFRLIF
jgi:hypothetical protein